MVMRFLVTTALEETWHDDVPTLFLGEWCRRYSRKDRWSKMDAEVLPYHWDDRAKMYADYQYLQDFYERLLQNLTVQLNQIHGVDHGLRYWRILIGPWLGYFTQALFDRMACILQAVKQYDLSETAIITGQNETLVPNDMDNFIHLLLGDEWNHHIYAHILQKSTNVTCIQHPWQSGEGTPKVVSEAIAWKQKVKRLLATCYGRLVNPMIRDQDAFFLATYLPLCDEMRMHWRMGQVPQLWYSEPPAPVEADGGQRQWIVPGENYSAFEACVRALIPQQIPRIYLEGYSRLVEHAVGLPWPKQPSLIWTSNSYLSNDVFKAWAAEKVECGAPLVVGQHGGHNGMGLWSFPEDHEVAISDRYLSWGWTSPGQPNVKPVGQLKAKRPLGVKHGEQPGALLVMGFPPRYSFKMYSGVISRQALDYFSDQCSFVEQLPQKIRSALTVRLYPHDYGWDQVDRWRDRFPNMRLDEGECDINKLISQSRIYISTYNAATYLESFTMDVPTVIFWNPNHWSLRESAIPYFDELKSVGIFHETPEAAAHHVATVWEDVDSWWNSPEVRQVLDRFKKSYCHLPKDLLDRVHATLSEVITGTKNEQSKIGITSFKQSKEN